MYMVRHYYHVHTLHIREMPLGIIIQISYHIASLIPTHHTIYHLPKK